jgi:hypothetical protein
LTGAWPGGGGLLEARDTPAASIQPRPPVNDVGFDFTIRWKNAGIACWSCASTTGASAIAFSCAIWPPK